VLDFRGSTVLITGGAHGIGRATALRFAEAGAAVAVLDHDAAGAEAVAVELRALGAHALGVPCDVGVDAELEAAFARTRFELGAPSIVLHNAAWYPHGAVTELAPEDWERTVRVCLTAAVTCARLSLPDMQQAGSGALVFTSSVHAVRAFHDYPAYSAVKAGVLGLMRQLAVQYGPFGVRVNAVVPGPIDTRIWGTGEAVENRKRARAATVPLRRLGTPLEVANATLFLASPLASFITGVALPVDGGMLIAANETLKTGEE
jgi:NAD(P)-dependent dehydrogenase (short-subunit alcohol dehydrogenase family)